MSKCLLAAGQPNVRGLAWACAMVSSSTCYMSSRGYGFGVPPTLLRQLPSTCGEARPLSLGKLAFSCLPSALEKRISYRPKVLIDRVNIRPLTTWHALLKPYCVIQRLVLWPAGVV